MDRCALQEAPHRGFLWVRKRGSREVVAVGTNTTEEGGAGSLWGSGKRSSCAGRVVERVSMMGSLVKGKT